MRVGPAGANRAGSPQPAGKHNAVQVLPCDGGEGIVRFDLSALPQGARVRRADLRIFQTSRITGKDEDGLVNIEIYPLLSPFRAGGKPKVAGRPLELRAPWYDRIDATEAVRKWVAGRTGPPRAEFFVKACPRWDAEATCLDVCYEGRAAAVPPQVKDLKVFHRSGQTFITWREIDDPLGKDRIKWGELKSILAGLDRKRRVRYCVYRSKKPITAGTLQEAKLIAEVKPLSCWNVNGRNIERPIDHFIATEYAVMWGHGSPFGRASTEGKFGLDCSIDRFVIREGEGPLPRQSGLYVHTPGKPGRAYYAVVTSIDGVQNTVEFSPANALAEPVGEAPAEPEPVGQGELPKSRFWNYPDRRLHYVRWVAPPYGNLPYQYYNWSVAVPEKLGKDDAAKRAASRSGPRAPLEVNFHRDGGSYWRTHYRLETNSVVLCPHDFPLRTWWYGYHQREGTLRSFRQGVIQNFTQRRLISFIKWAVKEWPVDPDRVVVTGVRWSGGSGALHLGLRHPELFSLIVAGHGIPDYARAVRDTKGTRRKGMLDEPVKLWGKLEWAVRTDGGKNVWEELNVTRRVRELPAGTDLPLVAITAQHYIAWGLWPGWHEFFNVMLEKRHAIMASFSWYGAKNLPVSTTGTYPNVIRLDVRRNLPMPAVKGPGTKVLQKPTGGMGGFNVGFRWRDPLGRPDRFEVTIFWSGRGAAVKSDVTLRRLQQFRVGPGRSYSWVNRSRKDEKAVQEGEVTVGDDGLLTIPGVDFHSEPTRLVVTAK